MYNCVLSRATLANDTTQVDFDEWEKGSSVTSENARLNLRSIEDPVEIAKLLNWQKYFGTGGWYVLSCDPKTGKRGIYGQFKPKSLIQFPDKDKAQKYFTSPKDAGAYARIEAKLGGPMDLDKVGQPSIDSLSAPNKSVEFKGCPTFPLSVLGVNS